MQLSAGFVSAHLFVEYGFSFGFVVVCAVAVLMVFQVKLLKIYDIQKIYYVSGKCWVAKPWVQSYISHTLMPSTLRNLNNTHHTNMEPRRLHSWG